MKYNLVSSVLENAEKSAASASYIFKWNNKKVGRGTIRLVPDIRTDIIPGIGEVYSLYFVVLNKSEKDRVFRLTSKQKNFSTLTSLDLCDGRWQPVYGLEFRSNPPEDILLKSITTLGNKHAAKEQMAEIQKKFKIKNVLSAAKRFLTTGKINDPIQHEARISSSGITSLIGVLFYLFLFGGMLYYYYRKVIHYETQRRAETEAEKDINNSLFSKQKENEPAYAIYDKLIKFIKNTIKGTFPATIICGRPGTGKTYIVRRTFHFMKLAPRKEYKIEKGASLELIDVFSLLYDMRDGILVLDDYDTPLRDPDTVNFLKSITDSYKRRIISMPRAKKISSGEGGVEDYNVPQKFEYNGKLIIITNIPKNQLDRALLSRCPTIEVDFSIPEMVEALQQMYKFVAPNVSIEIKKEVLDYVMDLYDKDKFIDLSFRSYQNCVGARLANPDDWREMSKIILNYRGR